MFSAFLFTSMAYALPYSATFMQASDLPFAELVSEHFSAAKECWKQRRLPTPGLMRNETLGFIEAQARFWPSAPEYRVRLLAFMLSEGGGLPDGNPDDPSYGVMCVHAASGRYACWYSGLPVPVRERDFVDRLRNDSRFCILVAAAELAWKEQQAHDWLRAVAQVKYGSRRYGQVIEMHKDKPVALLAPVRHYVEVLGWLECLHNYRKVGAPMLNCACLPRE